MTTLMIKDLPLSDELNRKAMVAVRGGIARIALPPPSGDFCGTPPGTPIPCGTPPGAPSPSPFPIKFPAGFPFCPPALPFDLKPQ
jgi:hypothetical protein